MTIDEAVREYMAGWSSAAHDCWEAEEYRNPHGPNGDAWEHGYAAGRAAYEAAERAERERLAQGRCQWCRGERTAVQRYTMGEHSGEWV